MGKFKQSDSKGLILLPQHKKIETIANEFLQQYRLTHWKFAWLDSRKFLGKCFYEQDTIALSRYYCLFLPEYENIDTILHEIAHALTWEQYKIDLQKVPYELHGKMAKAYLGHGLIWELKCKEVSAKPQACYDGEIKIPDVR